ncbi:MAG: HD domain-containing protein, partial [Bdellovibrionales bacterium]|nr:HD domain-containing protein [Bdellovibrionales bacterium]
LRSTLDVHSIEAVEVLPDLISGSIPEFSNLAHIFQRIPDLRPVIRAALLHDTGMDEQLQRKAMGQSLSHEEIGATLVNRTPNREALGEISEEVAWLIRHHSLLIHAAYGLNPISQSNIEAIATIVKTQENLDALLLLTIADKYSSNSQAFTPVKQNEVLQVYRATSRYLAGRSISPESGEVCAHVRAVAQREISSQEVQNLLRALPSSYSVECPPPVISSHLNGIVACQNGTPYHLEWISTGQSGIWHLALVTHDRPQLLLNLTSAIFRIQPLSILQLHLFPHESGLVCDYLTVGPVKNRAAELSLPGRPARVAIDPLAFPGDRERYLLRVLKELQTPTLPPLTLEDIPQVADAHMADLPVEVLFEKTSPEEAILRVKALDRRGIAFLLSLLLDDQQLNISQAKFGLGNRGFTNYIKFHPRPNGSLNEHVLDQLAHSVRLALTPRKS